MQPVLDTLCYLKNETRVWFEITNLIIPGENDRDEEIYQMCEWIATRLGVDVPVHFTAFHPDFKMQNHSATPRKTLTRARAIAQSFGLRYVYTGNVHDKEGSSTYCHQCGQILIERDWYQLGQYHLVERNQCSVCRATCSGVFAEKPGDWGSKRQPVYLHSEN